MEIVISWRAGEKVLLGGCCLRSSHGGRHEKSGMHATRVSSVLVAGNKRRRLVAPCHQHRQTHTPTHPSADTKCVSLGYSAGKDNVEDESQQQQQQTETPDKHSTNCNTRPREQI